MRLGIFTENPLTYRHGTGAQVLRLLAGTDIDFFHLYYWNYHGGKSDCDNSYCLNPPSWALRGGVRSLTTPLGLTWWRGTEINTRKFQQLRAEKNLTCDVVYVLVWQEELAQRAASVLRELGCPFVVHLMDLWHTEGLNPEMMPGFRYLLENARSVLVITEPLRREAAKFRVRNLQTVFIGEEATVPVAQPPPAEGPVRAILAGRRYDGGLKLLAESLENLSHKLPRLKWVYAGADYDEFPASVRERVEDLGFLEPAPYRKALAESHLAFLMGPTERDNLGLYSFPSRTADYLMAGLPLLACVAEGTATADVLKPLSPVSVRFTRTPAELLEAATTWLESKKTWQEASEGGRAFALEKMSLEKVRKQVVAALEEAASI